MKLLVTGANGFLGQAVVAEALRRGHTVRAMVRSLSDARRNGWEGDARIEPVQADLRRRKGLAEACAGCDAVLHLAAAKAGDIYAQFAGTVVATENLLAAMKEAGVRHIVHISSFSVYNYLKMWGWSQLDENSPVETDAFKRDEYAQTKVIQENLVREYCVQSGWDCTVLRPGVIYGKDNLWTARLGMQAGRIWVRMGSWSILPLAYVENCAEAIVLAAEKPEAKGQTYNVVDDERPLAWRYTRMVAKRLSPKPIIVPVPWVMMRFLARMAVITNRVLLGGRAKIPGIFVPAKLHARCKPLRFSNARIKKDLGWKPRYGLAEAIERSSVERHPGDGPMQKRTEPPVSVAEPDPQALTLRKTADGLITVPGQ